MPNRAAYKRANKDHWPDFKHKPRETRKNKKITNRMERRKKKQEVSGDEYVGENVETFQNNLQA